MGKVYRCPYRDMAIAAEWQEPLVMMGCPSMCESKEECDEQPEGFELVQDSEVKNGLVWLCATCKSMCVRHCETRQLKCPGCQLQMKPTNVTEYLALNNLKLGD